MASDYGYALPLLTLVLYDWQKYYKDTDSVLRLMLALFAK